MNSGRYEFTLHAVKRLQDRFPSENARNNPNEVLRDRFKRATQLHFHKAPEWQEFYEKKYPNKAHELEMFICGYMLFICREQKVLTVCNSHRMPRMRDAIIKELEQIRLAKLRATAIKILANRDKYVNRFDI